MLCASAGAGAEGATLLGETMGTTWRVTLPALEAPRAAAFKPRIDALLERINAQMSTYRPDSELSRFNASASTDWQPLSAELFAVLRAARAVSIASDGAFDVTVGPLVNLWGFGPEARVAAPPPAEAVAAARARVGHRLLELADAPPRARKARADLYVDLSAIAKGYAVDRVAALLDEAGLHDYLVDIGGELRAMGRNDDARPWQVGIALPVADRDAVAWAFEPGDAGVATSGNYRNFFAYRGHRYSHEIDPASGAPVDNDVLSVTVLARDCMTADAYATAFMVTGAERALALARAAGLEALFLLETPKGTATRSSAGFPAVRPAR